MPSVNATLTILRSVHCECERKLRVCVLLLSDGASQFLSCQEVAFNSHIPHPTHICICMCFYISKSAALPSWCLWELSCVHRLHGLNSDP